MLGLAKRLKCRILQASTSEVYGDPSIHPQTEGYWGNVKPVGRRSSYDEGKRCAETLFFDYPGNIILRSRSRAYLRNPTEFTMRELAELVLAATGASCPLVHQPLPQDDPTQRQPNI